MRKSRIVLAGVAVATAAAAGTAFTAANTMPTGSQTVGYGASTVTGITVGNVQYVPDATDHSLLSRVVFTTADSLTNKGASMSLRNSGGTILSTVTCSVGSTTITCTAPTNTEIASFVTVGLAVFNQAPASA